MRLQCANSGHSGTAKSTRSGRCKNQEIWYVVLCVYSTAGLQRVNLGAFERYGEVFSGAFIALVGVAFWLWPVV